MAFSTLLNAVLTSETASNRLENKIPMLKAVAIILDTVTCVAFAMLAILCSQGILCSTGISGLTGIFAGLSFGLVCLVAKDLLNIIIPKLGKSRNWGTENTEKYLTYVNIALGAIALIAFSALHLSAVRIIKQASCVPSFYSGFGASSGGVVIISIIVGGIARKLISK